MFSPVHPPSQTGIVSYVCFSLGITATTTITTMIEAYAANQSHQEDHIYALTCRRLDLLLKSLAAVIGIMSLAVSLLGIPCNVRKEKEENTTYSHSTRSSTYYSYYSY